MMISEVCVEKNHPPALFMIVVMRAAVLKENVHLEAITILISQSRMSVITKKPRMISEVWVEDASQFPFSRFWLKVGTVV